MKWGILATGTIAKKFASTVEQMGAEGEQLVAVGSRHLESAQAFVRQYGIPRCYDSYEALAADPEVEAIYVATLRGQILCTGIFHLVPSSPIHYNKDRKKVPT